MLSKLKDATQSSPLAINYAIAQLMGRVQTATIVKVIKVYPQALGESVGKVDVQPQVSQLTTDGASIEHGIIHGVPYSRVQGGKNAVIIDPEVGDLGICLFASRDISGVVKTKGKSTPSSARKFSFADGMYIGGLLNGAPEQYVMFSSAGITLKSPAKVIIDAPLVDVKHNLTVGGNIVATGNITGAQVSDASGSMTQIRVTYNGHLNSPTNSPAATML